MKKVVLTAPTSPVVRLSDCSRDEYYGVLRDDGVKGFITMKEFNSGPFKVLWETGLTKANSSPQVNADNLGVALANCICNSSFGSEVYQFRTPKELFKWLSEGPFQVGD